MHDGARGELLEQLHILAPRQAVHPEADEPDELRIRIGADSAFACPPPDRYKYLQKPFEETALKGILQYTNKFSPIEQEKLAVSTAVFVSAGLASASVLNVLKKDHLVKDCSCSSCPTPESLVLTSSDSAALAVNFLVTFCKSYLLTESLDHLSGSLRKGTVTNLEAFMPASHQTAVEFSTIFKAAGLGGVVDFYTKQKSGQEIGRAHV